MHSLIKLSKTEEVPITLNAECDLPVSENNLGWDDRFDFVQKKLHFPVKYVRNSLALHHIHICDTNNVKLQNSAISRVCT